jgi:hypothetical protein
MPRCTNCFLDIGEYFIKRIKKTNMRNEYETLIRQAYAGFNARDIDAVLSLMVPDVVWPNGWEGGYVHGHDEIRDYWTRQWKEINSSVEPITVSEKSDGRIVVDVHQLGKDGSEKILFEDDVKHIYTLENGLIKSMEIEKP